MIEIYYHKGYACPLIFCDSCDERIETASSGAYYFGDSPRGDGGRSRVYFVHNRRACSFPLRQRLRQPDSWGPLTVFMANLKHNLFSGPGENTKKAQAKRWRDAETSALVLGSI